MLFDDHMASYVLAHDSVRGDWWVKLTSEVSSRFLLCKNSEENWINVSCKAGFDPSLKERPERFMTRKTWTCGLSCDPLPRSEYGSNPTLDFKVKSRFQ